LFCESKSLLLLSLLVPLPKNKWKCLDLWRTIKKNLPQQKSYHPDGYWTHGDYGDTYPPLHNQAEPQRDPTEEASSPSCSFSLSLRFGEKRDATQETERGIT